MIRLKVYFYVRKRLWSSQVHNTGTNRLLSTDVANRCGVNSRILCSQSSRRPPCFFTQSATSTVLTDAPYILQLTVADCEEVMLSKLGKKSFQVRDFSMQYFMELLGFHGNYAGLKINADVNGRPQEFRFFVKTTANNPIIKEKYWDVLGQPYKEFVFLMKIHKTLQPFVKKKITSECHLGRLGKMMILDDLCEYGFVGSQTEYFNIHQAEVGIIALANLHAASLICEEKTGINIPEKYKDADYESLLTEYDKTPKENLLHSLDAGLRQMAAAFFTHVVPLDAQDALFSKIRKRVVQLNRKHPKEFRKVVCQGDPISKANMLYKYESDGRATDAILVDFGVVRFAPPGMEVMQFLYSNSLNKFRLQNSAHLKDTYYHELRRICAENGVDITGILPRSQFEESCSYYEEWGVCVRVYYEYVIRLPMEQLIQVTTSIDKFLNLMVLGNAELGLEAFPKSESYRQAVTEAMDGAMRFYGFIK